VRVAVVQAHPIIGDVLRNIAHATELVEAAVSAGAQVIVLPELVTTGYVFRDKAEVFDAIAHDNGMDALADLSRRLGIVLVAGVALRDGDTAINCAVLFEDGSLKATYVKTHSWNTEKLIFTAGATLPPVVETRFGRIGLAVCYDLEFPEVFRHLALGGAELFAAPTNWPAGFESTPPDSPYTAEMIRVMGNASTNRVFVAVACRTGQERGVDWVDRSAIYGIDGFPLAEATPGVGMAIADLELRSSHDKNVSPNNHVLNDRRIDLY
jgi:predicted amidohydrolase